VIERLFAASGHVSTALMAYGVAALWLHPDSRWAAAVVYAALMVLMLTPVSRVVVASVRFLRAGDRASALLTGGILLVIALSAWIAAQR
jgi:uncharacterized membrane protein